MDVTQVGDIAIGVPVIARTDHLEQLLESVPPSVETVYVADNGHTDDRQHLYEVDWPFDLAVLDLDYDVGIGACRSAIADACETEYLAVVDSDMEIPPNLGALKRILDASPDLGAVGGILNEPAGLRSGCCNLHEGALFGGRRALVHEIRGAPSIEQVAGYPIARFDKLANAMLVRRECLDDYTWDPEMADKEHLDWFLGHRETDWEFAVSPSVVFTHNTRTDASYSEQFRSTEQHQKYEHVLCEKWDVDELVWGDDRWFGTQQRPLADAISKLGHRHLPLRYWLPIKNVAGTVIGS